MSFRILQYIDVINVNIKYLTICDQLQGWHIVIFCKMLTAPGEAQTHNPGIAQLTVYKYRALTDCATGAHILYIIALTSPNLQ